MTPSREEFRAAVAERFGFLADSYGMELALDPRLYVVKYENSDLCVTIEQDWGSYHIYLSVLRKQTGWSFFLEEALGVLAPDEKRNTACSGRDTAKLTTGLGRLAGLCRERLNAVWSVDEPALAAVESWSRESSRRYRLDMVHGATRSKADRAWEGKDWKTALALYEQARPALKPYQLRRLEFLRRRSGRARVLRARLLEILGGKGGHG